MRLTLVSETYFPQMNGVSKVLDRLVRYAESNGHEVQLVIPRYRERTPGPNEVPVFAFPFPLYPEVVVPVPRPWKIWRRIKAFNPDLIHIATEVFLGLAVLRKAKGGTIPVVSSYHTNFTQYLRHYYMGCLENGIWKYLRWFHNNTLRTYCPSTMTREDISSRGFQNVEVWSRGVETDLFSPERRSEALRQQLGVNEADILAVYVGRLAKEKNLPVLLRVFEKLQQRLPAVKLLLVGDGPIRNSIEKTKPEGVICVGYKRGEALAEHFASADLFLFPSVTETFGNVVIEGLSCGVPVVGFRAGGVPHSVHHGENGLLAEPEDEESFLSNAEKLCRDKELRRNMSEEARRYARTQNWDRIFEELFASYRQVLEESRTSAPSRQT